MTAQDLDAKSLERYLLSGMTIDEIAEKYGVSRSTVWRRRRDYGLSYIRPNDLHPHDSPEQINACLNCAKPKCSGTCKLIKKLAQ